MSSTSTIADRPRGLRVRSPSPTTSTISSALDTPSTHTLINTNDDNNNIDLETSILIAKLFRGNLQNALTLHKGKSPEGTPPTDAEYILQVQSEQLETMLNDMQDARIARMMADAMSLNRQLMQELVLGECVARQDRETAMALERGEQMPRVTDEQRAWGGMLVV